AVAPPPVVVPRERGRMAQWWSDTLVFAGRNVEHIRQIPEKLLDVTLQPLMFGLAGPATAIATDLTEGVIDRFRSLPATRTAYLSGHYLAELGGLALSVAVLLGAGLLVGWGVHSSPIEVTGAFLLLFLFASAMIWIGTYVGLAVRTPDAVMGIAFTIVFPLTFVSNAFVPMESLPSALQWVAAWNPVSVVVAAIREMFGNPASEVV